MNVNTVSTIAKHLRDLYFGGNWTAVSFKDHIESISLDQALTKIKNLNTLAQLVYHCNYYVEAISQVLGGQPLEAKDIYSFDYPDFKTEGDWKNFKAKTLRNIEELALQIESLDNKKLDDLFVEAKYGTYYRNLHGLIEHSHYHLGQIVILKKLTAPTETSDPLL